MVIRVWRDTGGKPESARGRITMTANADDPGSTETTVASAEEIPGIVRNWLAEFESV